MYISTEELKEMLNIFKKHIPFVSGDENEEKAELR